MRRISAFLLCTFIAGSATAAGVRVKPVAQDEAEQWIRHTIPLPKQISITAKVAVPRSGVSIWSLAKSDPVVVQAVEELTGAVARPGPVSSPDFAIKLQIGGPEADKLRSLRNSDQAYTIIPGENGKGLRLIALTPHGLYYASKTLRQLARAKSSADTAVIPIVRVTDWPDLADRGFWGSDTCAHLKWLGDRKINYIEQIAAVGMDDEGRPFARPKPGQEVLVDEGPLNGIQYVPVVLHLEQVGPRVFAHYPNLKAQGGGEGAICYSQPEMADVLADWIVQLGRIKGVTEVQVWMSENLNQQGGCTCPECSKTDRGVLEARTILKAWEKAREQLPDVGLRMTTSEETEKSNALVFKELPKDVKVSYYHSLLTYTNGETSLLRKYLADYAKSGHYLGVVPNFDSTVHWASPFHGADFVHYRMNEFADKGLSGVNGYITPRTYYFSFNAEAAAEWSWNAKGRTPHEFALSWAVRQGYKDPAKFAEWADTVGPVEWDCYGSHWPAGEQRRQPAPVAELLGKGKLPELGYVLWDAYRVPFGDVKNEEQLDKDVADAEKALRLAKDMGDPILVNESLIAQGYINSMKALHELGKVVTPQGIVPKDREAARKYFRMYSDGLNQVIRELPVWEMSITTKSDFGTFTEKPVGVMQGMVADMEKLAKDEGVDL